MALRFYATRLQTFRNILRTFSSSTVLYNTTNKPPDSSLPTEQPKQTFFEDDPSKASGKTVVTILNKEDDSGIFVDAYSNLGFRLNNGMRVIGPCAVFPRSILHWNVRSVRDINEDSLSLFTMLVPKLDILVIGVGERENTAHLDPKIIRYLRMKKLNIEILPTDQALATFNFLNSEKRYVAGAFIPPSYMKDDFTEDDLMYSSKKDMFLLETDYEIGDERGELSEALEESKVARKRFLEKVYRTKEREQDPDKDKHEKY